MVCIDACKEGIGGVITQNGHINFYESRNIKEHEKNYATHDLELAENGACIKDVQTLFNGKEI